MNIELAEKITHIIINEPERYDQTRWTNIVSAKVKETLDTVINCDTTACVAGHASFLSAPTGTRFYNYFLVLPDSTEVEYEEYGQDVLELTFIEACYLFHDKRTKEEVLEFLLEKDDDCRIRIAQTWHDEEAGAFWECKCGNASIGPDDLITRLPIP